MFYDNKYTKWYNNIVHRAKTSDRVKTPEQYYESHHIIPKSLGGNNSKHNLVLLTAKEHYICHLLLPKMCADSKCKAKMVYAYICLSKQINQYRGPYAYTSRLYEQFKSFYSKSISGENCYMYGVPKTAEIRKKISETRINEGTGRGANNPMYGKTHSAVSKEQMSQTKKERWTEERRLNAITANPRTKPVQDHNGQIFPSLSEAGRFHGFVGLTGPQLRIKKEVWKYV